MNEPLRINFAEKLSLFEDFWKPRIIAGLNDYHFKLVKLRGEFVWHRHPETDEAFIVLEGSLQIEFRDGAVELQAGEMYVVPRGIEHKPVARNVCSVLLVEPAGTSNTGDRPGGRTAEDHVWI